MGRRVLIVCVSVSHGNTAAVAHAMAHVLRAKVRQPEQVDARELADYDLVGLGSGIFAGSHHRRLRLFVERMPEAAGQKAFVFSTSGFGFTQHRPWERSLEALLRGKGYDVLGGFACRGFDTWLPLQLVGGINKGHPNAHDLDRARTFARSLAPHPTVTRRRTPAG